MNGTKENNAPSIASEVSHSNSVEFPRNSQCVPKTRGMSAGEECQSVRQVLGSKHEGKRIPEIVPFLMRHSQLCMAPSQGLGVILEKLPAER